METTTIANDKWRLPALGVLLVLVTLVSSVVVSIAPLYAALLVLLAVGGLVFIGLLQRPHLVLYGLVFFMPYAAGISVEQLAGAELTPLTVLAGLLLAILGIRFLVLGRLYLIPSMVPWLVFILVSFVSFALGPQITGLLQGVWALYRLVVVNALLYFAINTLWRSTAQAQRGLKILSYSAALAGLIAVVQTLSGGHLLGGFATNQRYLGLFFPISDQVLEGPSAQLASGHLYLAGTRIYRGHGTFFAANYFGAFLSVILCMTWGLFRGARGWRRWWWGLVLGLQVGGVIATFSRSAWAAALAGLGISVFAELWLTGGRRVVGRVLRVALLMVPIGLVVLIFVLQMERVGEHFVTLLTPWKVPEFQWRLRVWQLSIEGTLSHPLLGAGVPTILDVPWYFANQKFSSHNLFLSVAYTNGLVVFVLFVFFIWQWVYFAWRSAKRLKLFAKRMVAMGLLGAAVAFLVAGVGSSLMSIESIATLFWFMIGTTTVIRREAIKQARGALQ